MIARLVAWRISSPLDDGSGAALVGDVEPSVGSGEEPSRMNASHTRS